MKNKGFSLVELLVAIAIAGIVAGSVGYLLTTSLRMFGNETADITEQQELQVTLNQIIDYAMESQTVVIKNSGSSTDYLALGTVDSSDRTKLNAEVFFVNDEKLYMCKTPIENYGQVSDVAPRNLDEKVSQIKSDALSASDTLPQYLLAENVTAFFVQLNGTKTVGADNVYDNPLSLDISLEFTKNGSSKEIKKKVSDKAVFRNTLKTKIYSDGVCYELKQDADALTITTETVKLEERTGDILIPGTAGVPKTSLNILEIVPDYSYDYAQYVIGGYNGNLNSAENITYGPSATVSPISSVELEGYILQTCGATNSSKGNTGANNVTKIDGLYPNTGVDLKAIVQIPESNRNGYYEYVGQANGMYAIDSYEASGTIATAGKGDSKPIVLGYTKTYNPTWEGDKKNWTEKCFNPVFEFCTSSEPGEDYYIAKELGSGARRDYDLVIKEVDGVDCSYYQYVGVGLGDYAVEFYKNNTRDKGTYNRYNGSQGPCYKVSQDYEVTDKDNGEYYAVISGWESRDISGYSDVPYERGYDFSKTISSAIMYSKFYDHPNSSAAISKDFGWIWHEASVGSDLYDGINAGIYSTAVGTLDAGTKETGETFARGTRLYLKNHYRYGLINNELFKLYVMQDVLEEYVEGTPKMLDILNGRWDVTNNTYSTVNDKALKAWESAGNKIKLDVRIPKDVTDDDIANCDMIVIGTSTDGGFAFANQWFNAIRHSSVSNEFSSTNDITFKQATEIYKRVCAEEISIACPYILKDVSGTSGSLNLEKMFEMTYCISNWDVVGDNSIAEYQQRVFNEYKNKKIEKQGAVNYWTVNPNYMKDMKNQIMVKGSGRDFFKDFLISMVGSELSKPLYADGTLKHKTTEFVYIDENGNIVVPAKNTSIQEKNRNGSNASYSFNYGSKTITSFGGGGGGGYSNFEANFLLSDINECFIDRYRAGISGLLYKNYYVFNSEYGYNYRFYYDDANSGVYRNMLLYNQTSDLFSFHMSGATGMMQLSSVKQSSHPETTVADDDVIGTLEYVGADDKESSNQRMAALTDSSTYKYEDNPTKYSFRLEKLGNGTNKKVFYMSYEDYERAKIEGLYLYVLIKTSKDPSNYNKCVLRYNQNEEDGGAPGRFDYDAYNYDPKNNETSTNVIKYKPGDGVNEAYVREYRYHANPEYFQHIYAPNNKGNNFIKAKIDPGDGREYEGVDELYFIIRDEFDLD